MNTEQNGNTEVVTSKAGTSHSKIAKQTGLIYSTSKITCKRYRHYCRPNAYGVKMRGVSMSCFEVTVTEERLRIKNPSQVM